ncbi:zinc finger protein Gfi-1 [Caerostris darwini]|uniref:Zinc finger protein Gfi-1 n=1 Tax=Caerostris darwini TaxID=1538125 RepID=A0AAV4VEK4_9ARAC|nr:zinc finger protein Gfi-1 [Caerostris darwini]
MTRPSPSPDKVRGQLEGECRLSPPPRGLIFSREMGSAFRVVTPKRMDKEDFVADLVLQRVEFNMPEETDLKFLTSKIII